MGRPLPSAGTFHLLVALGLSLSCSFAFQSHASPQDILFPQNFYSNLDRTEGRGYAEGHWVKKR